MAVSLAVLMPPTQQDNETPIYVTLDGTHDVTTCSKKWHSENYKLGSDTVILVYQIVEF